MTLHHDKHHRAYVNNLNAAIEKHPELAKKSRGRLIRDLNAIPEDIRAAVRNNGGGHVNHTMFWKIMKPKGGGDPTGAIAQAINKTFGNFEDFQAIQRRRRQTVRLRMGLARRQARRRRPNRHHPQSGQPDFPRPTTHPRQRRLGARLLPEIQEPASRISRRLVERSQLGRSQPTLRSLQVRQACSRTSASRPLTELSS